jgi:DNA-binding beta-propeller fold protein YncE
MHKRTFAFAALLAISTGALAQGLRATSEQTVGGFAFPESVAYDPARKVLYVGEFGGAKLAPAEKDGLGSIAKVDLAGKVLEKQFLPAAGGEKLNKPKGIWVRGDRLWVTDIDVVWVFDLKTKKGRKVAVPIGFANDPAVVGNTLYVSDNRNDALIKIEPADFLNAKGEPTVTSVFSGAGINPNGLYPARDGMLLMVGFLSADKPRGIYALGVSGQIKQLSDPIGRLDGIYEMRDGSYLATDWNSGSLFQWLANGEMRKLADGFKGPADFCVIPQAGGLTVVVPDLVQGQLRFVQLRN